MFKGIHMLQTAKLPHHAWQVEGLGSVAFPPREKKPCWQAAQVGLPAHPGAHAAHANTELWFRPGSVVVPFTQFLQPIEGGTLPALQVPAGQGAHPAPPVPGVHTVTRGCNGLICV